MVDGEEGFLRETACAEGDHDLGATGDGGMLAGLGGEEVQDRVESGWSGEGELSRVGVHKSRQQTVESRQ